MKKKIDTEMLKDDEVLREEAMADGPAKVLGLEIRPVTALTVSWMQRNEIFGDAKDLIWKSAAFGFLHSAPFSEIRAVVNDKSAFIDAVDAWIEKNIRHHLQTSDLAEVMNKAFSRYMSSASEVIARAQASGN